MTTEYNEWISEQAEKVCSAVNRLAMMGLYDAAVYVMPSAPGRCGELIVSRTQPEGTTDVVRFPHVGSRVAGVARSDLRACLWHACRHFPVLKP
jgi:hypothetical protein